MEPHFGFPVAWHRARVGASYLGLLGLSVWLSGALGVCPELTAAVWITWLRHVFLQAKDVPANRGLC